MSKGYTARQIVYQFSDFLGRFEAPISDEFLLPHSKKTIYDSFREYIQELKIRGEGNSGESIRVQSLLVSLFDFQIIDDEDIVLVAEINGGERFERFRGKGRTASAETPQDKLAMKELLQMKSKYLNRAIDMAPYSSTSTSASPPQRPQPTAVTHGAEPKKPRIAIPSLLWSRPTKATLIAVTIWPVGALIGYDPPSQIVSYIFIAIFMYSFLGLVVAAIFAAIMMIAKRPFLQTLEKGYCIAVIGLACLAFWGEQ